MSALSDYQRTQSFVLNAHAALFCTTTLKGRWFASIPLYCCASLSMISAYCSGAQMHLAWHSEGVSRQFLFWMKRSTTLSSYSVFY